MWSFFSKKNKAPKKNDVIWMSRSAKYKGLIIRIQELMKAGKTPVLITFFAESEAEAAFVLEKSGINFRPNIQPADFRPGLPVLHLCTGRELPFTGSENLVFLFAEHYPLPKRENDFLEKIPALDSFEFHSALDEALLERAGEGRLLELMKKLGAAEDECLSHTMISKSIARFQEKTAGSISAEKPANSAKEWYEKNLT